MPKKVGTPRLLVLNNKQAPSRGSWVIYPSMPEIGFTACHEIENETQEPRAIEEIGLKTYLETRSFCLDRIQNGWSINLGGAKWMATKKIKAMSKETIAERIQQVLWEKHLQEFPQRQYKCNPVIVTAKREGNQQNAVEYKNDV